MPNPSVRASARTMPNARRASLRISPRTRVQMERAVERLLAILDSLDAANEDLEIDHDIEEDPAEDGIADLCALEELRGEPSLGATEAIDQRIAWRGPSSLLTVVDGELEAYHV